MVIPKTGRLFATKVASLCEIGGVLYANSSPWSIQHIHTYTHAHIGGPSFTWNFENPATVFLAGDAYCDMMFVSDTGGLIPR